MEGGFPKAQARDFISPSAAAGPELVVVAPGPVPGPTAAWRERFFVFYVGLMFRDNGELGLFYYFFFFLIFGLKNPKF